MAPTVILVHLAGFVALLLWGMHMVHTGIVRAYGGALRQTLQSGLDNRFKAFAAGLGITALLQSSTATGLIASNFIAAGFMSLNTALAVILGANVGTTLIVQLLTFNVVTAAPVFVLAGLIAFKRGKTRVHDLGRAAIGVGLMLLSLNLIVATVQPVEQAKALHDLFALLSADPIITVVLAAMMTWAAYSSVAVVLLVMTLATEHIVTPEAALALVLGANLGNVFPQFMAAGTNLDAKRMALGNLIVRASGCLVALPLLHWLVPAFAALEARPGRQVADFHMLFNVASAAVFIGLLDPVARLCVRMISEPEKGRDPSATKYLTDGALATPTVALTDAAREALRIVDLIEVMLRTFIDALRNDDRKLVGKLAAMDDTVDKLHHAVKLHLTAISRDDSLSEAEAKRCADMLAFVINLEHIGDIIDKSLREITAKKIKHRLTFSREGLDELSAMHQCLLDSLHLATSVFMLGDVRSARLLLAAKDRMRDLEQQATDNHLRRMREGHAQSIETSALHIDIARDLKRIAAHTASVAYPILTESGALRRSRLVDPDEVLPPSSQHH